MITWITVIKAIIVAACTLITAGIPAYVALRNAWRARKAAETETEKEKANADLLETAKNFIAAAEGAFEGFDRMMKAQNSSAGAMKKDNVLTKLQSYALQNGYEFDTKLWSDKIDELVKFTKSVNAKR